MLEIIIFSLPYIINWVLVISLFLYFSTTQKIDKESEELTLDVVKNEEKLNELEIKRKIAKTNFVVICIIWILLAIASVAISLKKLGNHSCLSREESSMVEYK